jgi:hypothetical protein
MIPLNFPTSEHTLHVTGAEKYWVHTKEHGRLLETLCGNTAFIFGFINNAYANQSLLLNKIFKLWGGKNKTIINISSAITYFPSVNLPKSMNAYNSNKKNLDTLVKFLSGSNRLPHIMNIRPSWFESNLVKEFDTRKINPEDIANLIVMLYDMREAVRIVDIVLEKQRYTFLA